MGSFVSAEKNEIVICLLEQEEYCLKGVFIERHIANADHGYHCIKCALKYYNEFESNTLTRRLAC